MGYRSGLRRLKRRIPIPVKESVKRARTWVRHASRRIDTKERMLPSFLIVGAQKCGTTTLFSMLCGHPDVAPPLVKEVHYFDFDYRRDLSWYRAFFPRRGRSKDGAIPITGEASPYYIFHPYALERISEDLPGVKLILLLRNPVDRAYSSYHHQAWRGREKHSFETAIEREEGRLSGVDEASLRDPSGFSYEHAHFAYLARGRYFDQVRRCKALFPSESIKVVGSEDYFSDPQPTFEDVCDFLGLGRRSYPRVENVAKRGYAAMRSETRARLLDYFAPHNERLFQLLDRRFDWDE